MQIGTHLLQMVGGEIAAVVSVNRRRDTADMPLRQRLAPDRLAQHQGRLDGGWRVNTHPKPGNGPAVIIRKDGEPGPRRGTATLLYPQIGRVPEPCG